MWCLCVFLFVLKSKCVILNTPAGRFWSTGRMFDTPSLEESVPPTFANVALQTTSEPLLASRSPSLLLPGMKQAEHSCRVCLCRTFCHSSTLSDQDLEHVQNFLLLCLEVQLLEVKTGSVCFRIGGKNDFYVTLGIYPKKKRKIRVLPRSGSQACSLTSVAQFKVLFILYKTVESVHLCLNVTTLAPKYRQRM